MLSDINLVVLLNIFGIILLKLLLCRIKFVREVMEFFKYGGIELLSRLLDKIKIFIDVSL